MAKSLCELKIEYNRARIEYYTTQAISWLRLVVIIALSLIFIVLFAKTAVALFKAVIYILVMLFILFIIVSLLVLNNYNQMIGKSQEQINKSYSEIISQARFK